MSKFFAWLQRHSLLLVVLIIAIVVRIPLLNGSFWMDEAAQALESARPFSQQLNIVEDFQPPLLHYLIHFAIYLDRSEWWLRTWGALIPGIITVLCTYKIGELLWNKRTGLLAAVLLSTSSFHVFYSQELRQYSLPAGLATVSWYLLFYTWKKKAQPSWKVLTLFAVVSALGLYSSYLYPFLVISQLVFVLLMLRIYWQKWLASLVASGVAFLPLLPLFLSQLQEGSTLRVELPGWEAVVSFSQIKVLPLVFAKFLFGVSNVEVSVFFVAVSLAVVVSIGYLMYRNKNTVVSQPTAAILLWLSIPIITAFLISYLVPVLQPKRVLYCLPAFYLVLASLINLSKNRQWPLVPSGLIALLLITNIISLSQYWINKDLQRENWRDLIVEIEQKYPSQSAALFAFPEPFAPWIWYASPNYPAFSSGTVLTDTNPELLENIKKINEYNHVLLFEYLTDLTDPNERLKSSLESYGYVEQGYFMYPNIGHVWIYSKPTAVISYTYK